MLFPQAIPVSAMSRSNGLLFECRNPVENRLDHRLFTNRRVDHEVEVMTGWPFHPEVLFDEGRAVAIHRFGKLDRSLLALPHLAQPVYLLFEGSVDKNVKGVRAIVEVISRAASHDDGVASLAAALITRSAISRMQSASTIFSRGAFRLPS